MVELKTEFTVSVQNLTLNLAWEEGLAGLDLESLGESEEGRGLWNLHSSLPGLSVAPPNLAAPSQSGAWHATISPGV